MVVSMLVVAARRGWEEVTAKMRVAAPGEEDTDTAQAEIVLPVASLVINAGPASRQTMRTGSGVCPQLLKVPRETALTR